MAGILDLVAAVFASASRAVAFAGINELLRLKAPREKGRGRKEKSCGNKYDNEEVQLSVLAAAKEP